LKLAVDVYTLFKPDVFSCDLDSTIRDFDELSAEVQKKYISYNAARAISLYREIPTKNDNEILVEEIPTCDRNAPAGTRTRVKSSGGF
jgi:hypothetical protein